MDAVQEQVLDPGTADGMLAAVKGKRTKRQRLFCQTPMPSSAAASPSTSSPEFSGSITEEEEDMANCLILLARGKGTETPALKPPKEEDNNDNNNGNGGGDKFISRRFTETATTTAGKAGFYVYQCKDCDKCFPSFQALGGHRTSHKRPKLALQGVERNKDVIAEEELEISMNSFSKPNGLSGGVKNKVHECSICGAEFSSGQALGGHMRRHRPGSIPEVAQVKKERSFLALDLNLPAPPDEDRGEPSGVPFSGERPPLVFLTSAMVDCHY